MLLDSPLSQKVEEDRSTRWDHTKLHAQSHLDRNKLVTIIHYLITTLLDYCNAQYVEMLSKMVWKFQSYQNVSARLVIMIH